MSQGLPQGPRGDDTNSHEVDFLQWNANTNSAVRRKLPEAEAMKQMQAAYLAHQDEDPDPYGILSCPPDKLSVEGSQETLFNCYFDNPTK